MAKAVIQSAVHKLSVPGRYPFNKPFGALFPKEKAKLRENAKRKQEILRELSQSNAALILLKKGAQLSIPRSHAVYIETLACKSAELL